MPQCSQCQRKGRLCVYNDDDKRKSVAFLPIFSPPLSLTVSRLPFKSALRVLRTRIDALTQQLVALNVTPVGADAEDMELVNRVLEAVDLPTLPRNTIPTCPEIQGAGPNDVGVTPGSHHTAQSATMQSAADSSSPVFDSLAGDVMTRNWEESMSFADLSERCWDGTSALDWPWMEPFAPESDSTFNFGDLNGAPQQNANASIDLEETEEDEVDQNLVNEISTRAGALQLAPDGKLRYFGSPSNVHLLSNTEPGPYSKPRSLAAEGVQALRAANLDQAIESNIEKHLLNLFFSWYNSCHPVLERSFYWAKREKSEQDEDSDGFYSTVLTNAM